VCEHSKLRSRCKECRIKLVQDSNVSELSEAQSQSQVYEAGQIMDEVEMCEHGVRSECELCGVLIICLHNKDLSFCDVCNTDPTVTNKDTTKRVVSESSIATTKPSKKRKSTVDNDDTYGMYNAIYFMCF
jgi:hypothetical protein